MSIDDLANFLSSVSGMKLDAFHIVVVLGILGRLWHAATSHGGLVGIFKALLYGTNTPATNQEEQEKPDGAPIKSASVSYPSDDPPAKIN